MILPTLQKLVLGLDEIMAELVDVITILIEVVIIGGTRINLGEVIINSRCYSSIRGCSHEPGGG